MSLAIPQPRPTTLTPTSSSHNLATRPNSTMLPKQPIARVQPRPSSSTAAQKPISQRPMIPKSTSGGSGTPQLASRPSNNAGSSSSSNKVPIPSSSRNGLAMTPSNTSTSTSAPSPSSSTSRPTMASRTSSTASTPTSSSNINANANANGVPLLVPGKDTSSSAGKIFAKPSKEWVLPERAKPGRKVSVEEPDNKRQSQNRLSQRAHRARRTDYIQTLEERLRQYEADEIHSNVRLQEVARALKTDNERLKNELNGLKLQLMQYNGEKDVWDLEKRAFKESIRELRSEIDGLRASGLRNSNNDNNGGTTTTTTIVRMELDQNTIDSLVPGPSPSLARRQSLSHRHSYTRSNTSQQNIAMITNNSATQQPQQKDLMDCPICPNPDPDCPCQQGSSSTVTQAIKRDITLVQPSSCGLCHSTDECLCRIVVNPDEQEDIKPIIISPHNSSPTKSFKSMDDGCGLCAGGGFCACRAASDTPSNNSGSSGINKAISIANSSSSGISTTNVVRATSSASAMPLRLKSKSNTGAKQPIWSLSNVTVVKSLSQSPKTEAVCTGDPDNCDACKNDSFGREFCQHLFEDSHLDATEGLEGGSVKKGCGNCSGPGGCMSIKSLLSPSDQGPSSSTKISSGVTSSNKTIAPIHGEYDDEPQLLAPLQMACCGNPELCGGHHGTGCTGEIVLGGLNSIVEEEEASGSGNRIGLNIQLDKPLAHLHVDHDSHEDVDDHTKLRPDQAWKQLKAHPNAKFASLALLADVVARRTNVLGSMNSPSPAPSSPLSTSAIVSGPGSTSLPSSTTNNNPRSLNSASSSHHPTLGGAGKKRGFDIETSAVREALKYLDKATPTSSPAPEGLDERDGKRRRI